MKREGEGEGEGERDREREKERERETEVQSKRARELGAYRVLSLVGGNVFRLCPACFPVQGSAPKK